jgi:hypothetical protein
MTRARDVSRLVTTPPDIYATDTEASSGYLSLSSASSTYVPQNNAMFAGKNKIINGDFGIWQRGTSFTANQAYNADRWNSGWDSSPTVTISRQAFTAGTAPVTGYEGTFFHRTAVSSLSSMTLLDTKQYIEDVRTFANQTVTVSFWAKADTTRNITVFLLQNFGTSGSSDVTTSTVSISATTSWTRFSATFSVPSVTGKTINANNYLSLFLRYPAATFTIDIWGVQVEAGDTATPFVPAGGGSVGAELALCQRYYYLLANGATHDFIAMGTYLTNTDVFAFVNFPVTMRGTPTMVSSSGANYYRFWTTGNNDDFNDTGLQVASRTGVAFSQGASGLVSGTLGRSGTVRTNNSLASIAFQVEL